MISFLFGSYFISAAIVADMKEDFNAFIGNTKTLAELKEDFGKLIPFYAETKQLSTLFFKKTDFRLIYFGFHSFVL